LTVRISRRATKRDITDDGERKKIRGGEAGDGGETGAPVSGANEIYLKRERERERGETREGKKTRFSRAARFGGERSVVLSFSFSLSLVFCPMARNGRTDGRTDGRGRRGQSVEEMEWSEGGRGMLRRRRVERTMRVSRLSGWQQAV